MATSPSKINPLVEAKIRARELGALALGWTPEELWEPNFWNIGLGGNRRGLASCMRPDQEIGEITAEYIEVYREDHARGRIVQRFYKK